MLEHLIETLAGASIHALTTPFLQRLGLRHLSFDGQNGAGRRFADGWFDDGQRVPAGRLLFPPLPPAQSAPPPTPGVSAPPRPGLRRSQRLGGDQPRHGSAARARTRSGLPRVYGLRCRARVFVLEAGDNRVIVHQGANEGFRAIYLYVIAGPDADSGFVILVNGDNRGVLAIAEMAQLLIRHLGLQGVDAGRLGGTFDYSHLKQEQIVNLGYKDLIFRAFLPTLPEEIARTGEAAARRLQRAVWRNDPARQQPALRPRRQPDQPLRAGLRSDAVRPTRQDHGQLGDGASQPAGSR